MQRVLFIGNCAWRAASAGTRESLKAALAGRGLALAGRTRARDRNIPAAAEIASVRASTRAAALPPNTGITGGVTRRIFIATAPEVAE